jgi:hypothetical protein
VDTDQKEQQVLHAVLLGASETVEIIQGSTKTIIMASDQLLFCPMVIGDHTANEK